MTLEESGVITRTRQQGRCSKRRSLEQRCDSMKLPTKDCSEFVPAQHHEQVHYALTKQTTEGHPYFHDVRVYHK